MKSTDVSIVIPCYNHQNYVHEAIESALAQTYSACEVIVIDDGSTDESLSVIQKYGDKIRWQSVANRGLGAARNLGIELARGTYIKFLDADDTLLPDCVEQQVAQTQALSRQSKAIVFGDALWVDAKGHQLTGYPYRTRRSDEESLVYILTQSPLPACPLHHRDYLLEIGGFDSSIMSRHIEAELYLRLALSEVEFVYRPCLVYKYRQYEAINRLSQNYSRYGPLSHLTIIKKQIRTIEEKTNRPLSLNMNRIFAQTFWVYGRAVLREGHSIEAQQYFAAARELDAHHCIVGNIPYPSLVRLLGPQLAETFITHLRKLYLH